jgi:hypothetical protein
MSHYTNVPSSQGTGFAPTSAPEITDLARAFGQRRGAGAPVRRDFIERPEGGNSPLSKLLSGANASRGGGGRGGRIRVALVITLLWRLAKSPHTTIRPARYWAELLQIEDPDKAGSRTIRSTLLEIERRGFIRTEERGPGKVPEIILMDESLRGVDYKLPYLQAMEEGQAGDTSYFRVPETFWSTGLCAKLSGAGLAMYLIAMSRAGWGNQPSFWLAPAQFRDQYGLGDSTRKKGLRELVDLGVLTHELRSIDRDGHAGYRRFQRSVYTVVASYRTAGASAPKPIELLATPEPLITRRETTPSEMRTGRRKIGAPTDTT